MIATTPFEFATSIQAAGFLDPEGLLKPFGSLALAVACGILLIECALLIGLVLPGDSLLFIVGILLATGFITTPVWIAIVAMSVSAILGNLLGYWTGAKLGPKLFNKPDSRIFKQEYVVITQNFFEKHGPRAIVLARFVPVVRPVITSMAGVARMNFRVYATYSTIGGILWVVTLTLAGYFFGGIPFVADNIELVTLGIVGLSLIPVILEVLKQRKKKS
ncbi:MAG: VTT domain-containing protein [Actinobacteria bacterium]|nr:VTT domain-containing protein [Actinomycetota bacterium]